MLKRFSDSALDLTPPDYHRLAKIFAITLSNLHRTEHRLKLTEEKLQHGQERLECLEQWAHDIRSPLSALTLLAEQVQCEDTETLAIVKAAIKRIDQIAANILRSREHSDNKRPTDLAELLAIMLKEKMILAKDCGVHLISEFDSGPLTAHLDRLEFENCVSNLLNNSFEAAATKVAVCLKHSGGHALISISDNGKGISPWVLNQLGTKGFSHGKSGFGLGLHHARQTIEDAGGTLTMTSAAGIGTSVVIKLPLIRADH